MNCNSWFELAKEVATEPHQLVALNAAQDLERQGRIAEHHIENTKAARTYKKDLGDSIQRMHEHLEEIRGESADSTRRSRRKKKGSRR